MTKIKVGDVTTKYVKDQNKLELEWHWLPIAELQVDRTKYQRYFQQRKTDKIVNEFDRNKLDPLRVNVREDGTKWVVDGQHRLMALRRIGWDIAPCYVERNKSVQEEADQFIAVNTERSRPDALTLFKAAVTAGNEDAVTVQRVLEETGWKFTDRNRNVRREPGIFAAPSTALKVLQRYDELVLRQSLSVLRSAWPNDPHAGSAALISGMARLLFQWDDVVTIRRLEDKLLFTSPVEILTKAKQIANALTESGQLRQDEAVGRALFTQYQSGLRKKVEWTSRSVRFEAGKARRVVYKNVRPSTDETLKEADKE
jgi:hypothetical protein